MSSKNNKAVGISMNWITSAVGLTLLIMPYLVLSNENLPDSSYWDARLRNIYIHNSELQRRWASFIAPHLKILKGNERILDVGCGDGKVTADISRFIPDG